MKILRHFLGIVSSSALSVSVNFAARIDSQVFPISLPISLANFAVSWSVSLSHI